MNKQLPPLLPLTAKFTDNCGRPLKGGKVFVYEINSLIEKKTYADAAGTYENTNPIALDAEGSANIYYDGFARVVVFDNRGTKIHDVNNHGFPSVGGSTGGISQTPTINASGMPIGAVYWWAGKDLPKGAVPASGQLFDRAEHPILWESIEQGRFHIIPDADWLAYPARRAMFSLGDGISTYRLPDINGAQKNSIKAPVLRGNEGALFGTAPKVLANAMLKITGTIGFNVGSAYAPVNENATTGAFKLAGMTETNIAVQGETTEVAVFTHAEFDSSATTVPHADEIRPNSAFGCYVIQVSYGFDVKGVVTSVNGLYGDVNIESLLTITDDIGLPNPPTAVTIKDVGIIEGESPTISGTGEDGQSVTLKIEKDGKLLQQLMTTVLFDNTWSIKIAALSYGTYNVTAEHTDSKGNTTKAATMMTLIRGVIPVTINPLGTQNTERPTISGTGEPGQAVEIEIKGSSTINLSTVVSANKSWSVISSLLANGDYVVTATHTDIEGNTTTATELLKIDTEAPAITINTPATSSNNVVTITGTGEAGLTVRVTGAGINETTTVNSSGTWSLTATLAIGLHTLTATITDEAGNTATATSNEFEMIDPNSIGMYDPAVNQSTGHAMNTFGLIGGPHTVEPQSTWSMFLAPVVQGETYYLYLTTISNPSCQAFQKISRLSEFSGNSATTLVYLDGSDTSGRLTPVPAGYPNWYKITVPNNPEIKGLGVNLFLASSNNMDLRQSFRMYKGELPNDVLNPVTPAAAPVMARMMSAPVVEPVAEPTAAPALMTSYSSAVAAPVASPAVMLSGTTLELLSDNQEPNAGTEQQVEKILGYEVKDNTSRKEIVKVKTHLQNQSEAIANAEASAVQASAAAKIASTAAETATRQAAQAVEKVDNLQFKTINNQSILGTGNIEVMASTGGGSTGGTGGGSTVYVYTGSRLKGKNWLMLGDSITEGTKAPTDKTTDPTGFKVYFEETGATVTNMGSSGATANRLFDIVFAGQDLPRRNPGTVNYNFPVIDFSKFNVITIQIGTNNTEPEHALGVLADVPALDNIKNYSAATRGEYWAQFPETFVGSLCACVEEIREKNPNAEIYLITPPQRERTLLPLYGADKYQVHRKLLKDISARYGLPLIDAIAESGISYKNMNPTNGLYTYDGTHFNALGNKIWGQYIARKVSSGYESSAVPELPTAATVQSDGADLSAIATFGSSSMEYLQGELFTAFKAKFTAVKTLHKYGASGSYFGYTATTAQANNGTFTFTGETLNLTANAVTTDAPSSNTLPHQAMVKLENGVEGKYFSNTFTPTNLTAAIPLPLDGKLKYQSIAHEHRNCVVFVNLGKNDIGANPSLNADKAIMHTDKSVEYFDQFNNGRTMVIGHFNNTTARDDQIAAINRVNTAQKAKYFKRYFDLNTYLLGTQVWTDLKLTKTQADIDAIAKGVLPPSLGRDSAHLSAALDKQIAKMIAEQVAALGWYN